MEKHYDRQKKYNNNNMIESEKEDFIRNRNEKIVGNNVR